MRTIERNIYWFADVDQAKQYYFDYCRNNGYPNYDIKSYNPEKEYDKIKRIDCNNIISNGIARQSMSGCGFLWCFFPHWTTVKTFNDKSLDDYWQDDDKLRTMINKTVDWCIKHENGRMSFNRIRQLAKVYLCKQSPSNFRPTVAKALYDLYGNKGAVYDPCGGWGGRLFGFLASDCQEYVCCEPSEKTYEGLLKLSNLYTNKGKRVSINCICQEDYEVEGNHFDFVFTSPPYYDCEKYSEESTQSYVRYNTYLAWQNGFLKPLIQKAYIALKPNSVFILNIANTKNAKDLEDVSVRLAQETGFILEDTLKLTLSSIAGKGVKYEPMFVFRKQ